MKIAPVLLFVFAATLGAQAKTTPAKFPAKGYRPIKLAPKKVKRLDHSLVTGLDPKKNIYELSLERPPGYEETVLTDSKGNVLARGEQKEFNIPGLDVGFRYRIYVVQPKRRYLLFRDTFVNYPFREFPGEPSKKRKKKRKAPEWKPAKDAELKLERVKQFTPKTMAQSFDQAHRVLFKLPKTKQPALYLMTRVAPGTNDDNRVARQAITGELEFWGQAKKGQQFRIHQLFPHDRTYRSSKVMTVEKDYPLGR